MGFLNFDVRSDYESHMKTIFEFASVAEADTVTVLGYQHQSIGSTPKERVYDLCAYQYRDWLIVPLSVMDLLPVSPRAVMCFCDRMMDWISLGKVDYFAYAEAKRESLSLTDSVVNLGE